MNSVIAKINAEKMAIDRFVNRIKKPMQSKEDFIDMNEDKFWSDSDGVHYCDILIFDQSDWIDKYFEGGE